MCGTDVLSLIASLSHYTGHKCSLSHSTYIIIYSNTVFCVQFRSCFTLSV